jgi:hypothetical protein
VGNGATSFDGELNLESPSIFWQSSVPNLRYLTNYGAIRTGNLFNFGYPALTNSAAIGILSEAGTNVVKLDKVTLGANQYLFVGQLTNSIANQVAIVPNSFDATMNNLIAAINGGSGAGTAYSSNTVANPQATAGALVNGAFTVTSQVAATTTVASTFTPATGAINLSWGGHSSLYGGTNIISYLYSTAFINNSYVSDQGANIYAGNFVNNGTYTNGVGSFTLQSFTSTLTNSVLYAGADVSITADSLVTSNLLLVAPRSLTLTVTNELTDMGYTNNNVWRVGSASVGLGFNLPVKPAIGDLLGTTITLAAPTNRTVTSVWAGEDRGLSSEGYTNNVAIGEFILDVSPSAALGHNGVLAFNGAGVSNAIYIDLLVLTNYATQGNATNNYDFAWLNIGTNMMVYYAQALENGRSVAEAIDGQSQLGANHGRLRWIYSYAGFNSSTNLYYTNAFGTITTNTVNTALAQSAHIDSDSDGIPNIDDPTPFFEPYELNFMARVTNSMARSVRVQWTTIPNATNAIYYTTNLLATNWLPYTNFGNWYFGNNVAVTNPAHVNAFASPQIYINNPALADNSQQTNVWIYDAVTNIPHYYKVVVWPSVDFTP